ncbi:sugar phosphate isomerase/epimerase family protein [Herbiconiux sp. UC225_62]|uniref:sugar phosphate isomerase/epimerase family protein n=1 Tax=Herbiconiux sp. UC225_62 TaxID=3350168 RepID=UPI0036D368A0
MRWPVYGMDVGFYSHTGHYPLATRCAMLADLGFDATNLTLWSEAAWHELDGLTSAAQASGLSVASLYVTVDLSESLDSPANRRVFEMISTHRHTPVELTFSAVSGGLSRSDPAGDDEAARFIERAIEVSGGEADLRLYPHFSFWMERVADALRLVHRFDGARLGITFPAFHVYALEGSGFNAAFDAAVPHLAGVNTNGSRRLAGQYFPVTIESIGEGDFDNFAFIGRLRESGYAGTLGIQAYGVGGDPHHHFGRSLRALQDIESRLDRNSDWARTGSETL